MSDLEIRNELVRLIETQKGDALLALYATVKDHLGIHKLDAPTTNHNNNTKTKENI